MKQIALATLMLLTLLLAMSEDSSTVMFLTTKTLAVICMVAVWKLTKRWHPNDIID